MRSYEYKHRVCFEDTNALGNVYFAAYIQWQGRCRETFLHEHAPELAHALGRDFALATTRVTCSFYEELTAFDEVLIRLSAGDITPSRLTMVFRYFRVSPGGGEVLVAEGDQEIVCVKRQGANVEPIPIPESLRDAVSRYIEPSNDRQKSIRW